MSEKVAKGIRDHSGFWNHGHTYQAHPISCAASLAVQKVIHDEDLLTSCRIQGAKLSQLLRERLLSPNSLVAPFVFDIRGAGLFWAVEFDFTSQEASAYDFKAQKFAMLVQAKCIENGLIIMGMTGGANLEGTEGDHIILAPAYNITDTEVEKIVDGLVKSIDEVLTGARV